MIIFQNIRILNPQMEQQDEKYMREALREAAAALAAQGRFPSARSSFPGAGSSAAGTT